MRHFAIVCLVAALSLCLLPLAASAQVKKDSIHTSVMGGGIFPSGNDIKAGGFFGAGVGYNFTENWGIEAFGAYAPLKTKDNVAKFGNKKQDVNLGTGRLDGLYHFNTGTAFVPYLAAGLGGVSYNVGGSNDESYSSLAVNGGIGFKYFLSELVALRVDARDMYAFNKGSGNGNYVMTTAGLTFQFETSKDCLDEDNDGVCDEYDACPGTPAGYKVDSRGCPIIETINLDIHFDFDKSVIKDQYRPEVTKVANFMSEHPKSATVIEGHTDNRGTAEYNQKLSQRRADAVRNMLINSHGIASTRLQSIGYGLSKPVDSNDTDAGRAKNRRVEAHISGAEPR